MGFNLSHVRQREVYAIFLAAVIVMVVLFVIELWDISKENPPQVQSTPAVVEAGNPAIFINGQKIEVDLADSENEWVKGLSGRLNMAQNKGMFFVFDEVGEHAIWMKDMNFAIDIIWFDQEFRVVAIKEDVLPESFPEIFLPKESSLYVLELNAGVASSLNIKIGQRIIFKK